MSAVNEAREVVTSVRIEENERHWRLTVFNRGGNAGTLTVDASDGPVIVARLYTDHAAVRAEALAEVRAKVVDLPLMVGPDGGFELPQCLGMIRYVEVVGPPAARNLAVERVRLIGVVAERRDKPLECLVDGGHGASRSWQSACTRSSRSMYGVSSA